MKIQRVVLFLICIALFSCGQQSKSDYSVSGKAQKGPFLKGSEVSLFELDKRLHQTGNSFLSTTTSEDGSFKFDNIALKNSLALINVNGYYFSELFGEISPAPITLQCVTEISDEQAVNVNVMTHLIRNRIETLVAAGQSYQEAKSQSESELLSLLGVPEIIDEEFEAFDISKSADQNAILLALSLMVQKTLLDNSGKATLPAVLTTFLSTFSSDFGEDGKVDQSIIDELLLNLSNLNQIDIRNNVKKRYEDIGVEANIADFEKYLKVFQQKYSDSIYTYFVYPEAASPDPIDSPESKVTNILVPQNTEFLPGVYTIAAIVPLNSNLAIKFILQPGTSTYGFALGILNSGWEIIPDNFSGIMIQSQRQNQIIALLIELNDWGTAKIEYYEDSEDTPTFVKTISWDVPSDKI